MREELRKDWCDFLNFWHQIQIQIQICLIQTQVGGLGKWLVGHLWLLHTSNHGQDVRLLLRCPWNHIANTDLCISIRICNFTNMDIKNKYKNKNVFQQCSAGCGDFGGKMKWFESKCFSRQLFRQMQQRASDGFDKTSTNANYACRPKNVVIKTSAGRNQYCTQIFSMVLCVKFMHHFYCFWKMKYSFDEHTLGITYFQNVLLCIHRVYCNYVYKWICCAQMPMWSTEWDKTVQR